MTLIAAPSEGSGVATAAALAGSSSEATPTGGKGKSLPVGRMEDGSQAHNNELNWRGCNLYIHTSQKKMLPNGGRCAASWRFFNAYTYEA